MYKKKCYLLLLSLITILLITTNYLLHYFYGKLALKYKCIYKQNYKSRNVLILHTQLFGNRKYSKIKEQNLHPRPNSPI